MNDAERDNNHLEGMKDNLKLLYNKRKKTELALKQLYDDIELLETMILYKLNNIKNKNDITKNTGNNWIRNNFTSNR